ncbi:MAG: dipeptidyl-peptidase 3 family protein [Paludibacter sp.]
MYKKLVTIMTAAIFAFCNNQDATATEKPFVYSVDKFADIEILRYEVPDFDKLSLKQKEMIYYLSQASIEGRDILFDQNHKNNLTIRRTLESIYINFKGDRNTSDFKNFTIYLKQVWMGNGIHHHYSEDKFTPKFSKKFFADAVRSVQTQCIAFVKPGESIPKFIARISPIIFDATLYAKRTNQEAGVDLIQTSANNYYEGVTQSEVESFYEKMKNPADNTPISYGLNSKLVKENGIVTEKTYRIGGMYSTAIERIVKWLSKASAVAENAKQREIIETLIEFYKTGDLKTFDQYAIKWVQDIDSQIDFINGFTESYGDPLGMKASWESLINFKKIEATKRTQIISNNAQWFEDNSPIDPNFRKETVKGVSAKVITAAMLGGDCYPATPIGVNLPNSNWIRRDYGSKSVTIENITEAYDKASLGNGFAEEFMWSKTEIERAKKYASLTNNLHTDLHECLGHGSGKLLPGVDPDALKAYGSTLEEARADLFGLYYMGDPIMVKLGLLPNDEAYKAEYYQFLMNGLMTQLTRIKPGKNIEEAHMRNRQLIASWVFEKGTADKVIEMKQRNGETYIVVNDYVKVRALFGQLLAQIQEIKSTGNFEKGKELVESFAVKVNSVLHAEILGRYGKLNLAPYRGFVNPVYTLIKDKSGIITDVKVSYNENYVDQHLRYSKDYSVLPNYN